MIDGSVLALFAGASLPLILFPGPSVAFIVTQSIGRGRRSGLLAVAGIEVGYLVHVAGVALGVSTLLAASALAFSVVKYLGAAYLLLLAWRSWRSGGEAGSSEPLTATGGSEAGAPGAPFRRGLLVGALNVKTALFFLAFLPQFADPARGNVPAQLVLLGVLFIALAAVFDSAWAIGAAALRGLLAKLRRGVMDRVSAGAYVALAGLALSVRRSGD
jgi:threonine/homoserine/homoserine lactone efflux protein